MKNLFFTILFVLGVTSFANSSVQPIEADTFNEVRHLVPLDKEIWGTLVSGCDVLVYGVDTDTGLAFIDVYEGAAC